MDYFIEQLEEYGFRLEEIEKGKRNKNIEEILERMMAPKANEKTFKDLIEYYSTIRIEDKEKFVQKMNLPESYLMKPDFFYDGFCLDYCSESILFLKFSSFYSETSWEYEIFNKRKVGMTELEGIVPEYKIWKIFEPENAKKQVIEKLIEIGEEELDSVEVRKALSMFQEKLKLSFIRTVKNIEKNYEKLV